MTLTSAPSHAPTTGAPPPAMLIPPAQQLADLLEGIATGEQSHLACLYEVTAAQVFGLACAVLRNASLAEEVTQDIFLEIWQHADRFDRTEGTALSWIMMLTRSRAADKIRHHQALHRLDHRNAATPHRPDVDVVVHDILAAAQRSDLHAALQSVTPRQREAITLTFFGGYSYRQASTILDVPLDTLKTCIRDGLINLRTALEFADEHTTPRRPREPQPK